MLDSPKNTNYIFSDLGLEYLSNLVIIGIMIDDSLTLTNMNSEVRPIDMSLLREGFLLPMLIFLFFAIILRLQFIRTGLYLESSLFTKLAVLLMTEKSRDRLISLSEILSLCEKFKGNLAGLL